MLAPERPSSVRQDSSGGSTPEVKCPRRGCRVSAGSVRGFRRAHQLLELLVLAVLLWSCEPSNFNRLVRRSRPIAERISDPSVVLMALYDPRVPGPAARGRDVDFITEALRDSQQVLGAFVPARANEGSGKILQLMQYAGMGAGEDRDWSFCRNTKTIGISGRFTRAGPGDVEFTYCRPGEQLRAVRFGIPADNRRGLRRLAELRKRLFRLVSGQQ